MTFTLNEADKLESLLRLNSVIRMLSTEYFGAFGRKTKKMTAAAMAKMVKIARSMHKDQHKHLVKQLLLFFLGVFEFVLGANGGG